MMNFNRLIRGAAASAWLLLAVPATLVLLPVSSAPALAQSAQMTWDVRNGDQQGKLMLKESELAFESLTDAKHSRTWKLAEVREISKRKRKDMRVRPMKGSTYDFQLKDGKLRDEIYNAVSERVIAARQGVRK